MNWFRKNIWLILSLAVAVFAGRLLLTNHHFYVHDDIQVFRVNEFVSCLARGQLPCRWASDLGKGYGEPWFNYYPPAIYLFPSLIHLLGFSLITSLNLFMFATFILAAWSMYLLVKELTGSPEISFFGSSLYTLYPFHATNVFLRGVYAENLAWSFAPFILILLYRQVKLGVWQKWLPFAFAFLFLTHIISSFILLGFSIFWVMISALIMRASILRNLLRLAWQLTLALAFAAFFFVPAIWEKNLVQSDTLIQGYYAFTNHFVSLRQLFLDYTWNYGASYWGTPAEEMGFMIGHLHTILLAILLIGVTGLTSARKNPRYLLSLFTIIAFLGFIFLAHPKSLFVWNLLPSLAYIQFPWRFIGWAGLPLVLSLSLLLSLIPQKISQAIALFTLVCLLFYSYPFFAPKAYDSFQDSDFLSGNLRHDQQTKSLFDYLPITVKKIPADFAGTSSQVVPTFYFPGWTANVAIRPNPETGLIEPVDPKDQVVLAWKETPFRLSMDYLSLASLLSYAIYLLKSHVQ